jgi:hypothetical protein
VGAVVLTGTLDGAPRAGAAAMSAAGAPDATRWVCARAGAALSAASDASAIGVRRALGGVTSMR